MRGRCGDKREQHGKEPRQPVYYRFYALTLVASTTQQHQDRHEREEDSQLGNVSTVFKTGRDRSRNCRATFSFVAVRSVFLSVAIIALIFSIAVSVAIQVKVSALERTALIAQRTYRCSGLLERSRSLRLSRSQSLSRSRRSSFRGEQSRVLRRGDGDRPRRGDRGPRRSRSRPDSKRHEAEGGVLAH